MGPPPKYLIQRKLLRSVTKKVLPKKPLLPQQYSINLFNCWKRNGIGSQKCFDEQLQYDFVQNQTRLYKKRLDQMRLPQIIKSSLTRPDYPQPGRHVAWRKYHIDQINLNYAFF